MSGQHTQGEWKQKGAGPSRKITCFGRTVATIISTSAGSNEEKEANARLIAAAPDMLEALQSALPALETWISQKPHINQTNNIATEVRAAIQKATGAQ